MNAKLIALRTAQHRRAYTHQQFARPQTTSMTWYTWLDRISHDDNPTTIARRIKTPASTVTRWRDGSTPSPTQAAAVARAYGRPVLEAFVAAGFLTEQEARVRPTKPSDLTAHELLDELRVRINRLEMSHSLETVTAPRPEHFDLAAMSGMSEGERLRNAMNAEQETPESFYDGGEPA